MTTIPVPVLPSQVDILVVGAGVLGLAHATEAHRRGLSVLVIDREAEAVGASVRNFGHLCITAQHGELLDVAMASRERWLQTAERAGFWLTRAGAVTLARSQPELTVLTQLAEQRPGDVELLTAGQVRDRLGPDLDPAVLGGAHLRHDLRVDPRRTVATVAAWLTDQPRVDLAWRTNYLGAEDGLVRTNRGEVRAAQVLLCVGHDVDQLAPGPAEEHAVRRCRLQMMRLQAPGLHPLEPAVLTATSMLRYDAFTATPGTAVLAEQVRTEQPDLVRIGANVMCTQLPDGSVLAGDSHHYGASAPPFLDESVSDLLLAEIRRYLGRADLAVVERWQGVYASSERGPLLTADVSPGVRAVSVTSGIGMTLSFGLARRTLDALT